MIGFRLPFLRIDLNFSHLIEVVCATMVEGASPSCSFMFPFVLIIVSHLSLQVMEVKILLVS